VALQTRGRMLLKTRSREYKSIVSRGLPRAHKRTHAPILPVGGGVLLLPFLFLSFFRIRVAWRGVGNKSPS